ncbi:MAG: NrfD/PsrC family molybdoenzyme membrane anchor subunit [Halorhodospira sp.]
MTGRIRYQQLGLAHPYRWLAALAGAGLWALLGAATGLYLVINGHHVTGMDNQVVWGLPHVFAILLILSGAGTLALAGLAPRLTGASGDPWGRLGTATAIALLLGGLAVLSLDLGSPQRLLAALALNLHSSFSRNLLLYTGFIAIALLYLGTLLEPRLRRHAALAGGLATLVALALALNVGSIFGMLAARPAYGGAIAMPLFLASALAYGTAAFSLAWLSVLYSQGQSSPPAATERLSLLLTSAVLVLAVLLALHLLALLYQPGLRGAARFLLIDGGIYPILFWLGVVAIGIISPTLLLLRQAARVDSRALAWASGLVLVGGLAHLFVMIVGVQALPLQIFPGQEVSGAVFDEEAASYAPAGWEFLLGLGGIGLTLAVLLIALRALPLTPRHLPGEAQAETTRRHPAPASGSETGRATSSQGA